MYLLSGGGSVVAPSVALTATDPVEGCVAASVVAGSVALTAG